MLDSFRIKTLLNQVIGWPHGKRPASLPAAETAPENFSLPAILDAFPAPVLLLDARRTVTEANQAAHEIFGTRLKNHDLAQSLRHPAALDAASAVLADG
ncbi:MAG: PAS domain-containing protein, partial [Alphaproteobacteria bacterium]